VRQQGKIRQVFLDWLPKVFEKLREAGKLLRRTEYENILKMLACRTAIYGYHLYKCKLGCGYEVLVPHSCKSRFCSVCGYIATDNWIASRFCVLLNCPYQHVVVTVPAVYRWMIKLDRKVALNFYLKCARDTIQEWAKSRGFKVGIVSFYHSFGGVLQFHPHFHLLVSCGGIKKNGKWQHCSPFPPNVLMEKFKTKFVSGMKDLFRKGKLQTKAPLSRVLYQIDHPYDDHWQFYVKRITRSSTKTMKYCIRYAKKMIMSEERIWRYDGTNVQYLCYKNENKKKIKFIQEDDGPTFIHKVIQHIPEKHFKLIRYSGFYANNRYTKETYQRASLYYRPLDTSGEIQPWRHRQWKRDRKDPLTCPHCNCEMVLDSVSYPNYYLMYNWEEVLAANHQIFQQRLVTCSGYSGRNQIHNHKTFS